MPKNPLHSSGARGRAQQFDGVEAALSRVEAAVDADEDDSNGAGALSQQEGATMAPLARQQRAGEALAAGGAVDIWRLNNAGYLAQYFVVGIVYAGLPATVYPFFLGYLSVPSFVYATVVQVIQLPWAFKFVFGMINDCRPLWGGYRRKPYMVVGWACCCATLLALSFKPLPPPYWCVDPLTGEYVTKQQQQQQQGNSTVATTVMAQPCNPASQDEGGAFALWMCLSTFGYVLADVAADGLTVEYARREPAATRGTTQSTVYFVRACGQITAALFVGLCMNGKEYNGTFDWSLGYSRVILLMAVPCGIMVPLSWFLVLEQPVDISSTGRYRAGGAGTDGTTRGSAALAESIILGPESDPALARAASRASSDIDIGGSFETRSRAAMTFARYKTMCWSLLQSKAIFYSIMYQFLNAAIGTVSTTANGNIQKYWAGVKTLQLGIFSIIGLAVFATGLRLVRLHFLGSSWRRMLLISTLSLIALDSVFTFCTVYGVVRNQYFFLGELVVAPVIEAVQFLFAGFVIVEMADDGNEGMVYGLMTTMRNCGLPFARALGNQIFGSFSPSLSDARNYIADSAHFRDVVAGSCALAYAFQIASIAILPLMPDQKRMAQVWKQTWPSRPAYGRATVGLVVIGWVYACAVNLLAMIPSTACLPIAGGDGCGAKPDANTTAPSNPGTS